MINVLSYLGMSLQSEVCLWTLVGLLSNIFDATLFKTNANLKQVWQMEMPAELSCMVQRILRTMISGVMLVQCFTVYLFLATYIVLLYPVFLEERPTLVLPWLLLAAIRKLLCELMSLAMGLGVCLLLGPARTACIKFVINKVVSIMPSFYMWMLVFSYYHALKIRSSFKSFSVVIPAIENDYGLELAVRRRRTKSLFNETQLRKKLVASLYEGRSSGDDDPPLPKPKSEVISRMTQATETDSQQVSECDVNMIEISPSVISEKFMSMGTFEGIINDNLTQIHRDVDRVLDQFTLMMLRIGANIKKTDPVSLLQTSIQPNLEQIETPTDQNISSLDSVENLSRLLNKSHKEKLPSYVQDYPLIFMKKHSERFLDQMEKRVSIDECFNKALHRSTSTQSQIQKLAASQDKVATKNVLPPPKMIEQATSPIESKLNYNITKNGNPPQELNLPQKLENKTSTQDINYSNKNVDQTSAPQSRFTYSQTTEEATSSENLKPSLSKKSLTSVIFQQDHAGTSKEFIQKPIIDPNNEAPTQRLISFQDPIEIKSSAEIKHSINDNVNDIQYEEPSTKVLENVPILETNQTDVPETDDSEKGIPEKPTVSSTKQGFIQIERKITLKITSNGKNDIQGAVIVDTHRITAQTNLMYQSPEDRDKKQ